MIDICEILVHNYLLWLMGTITLFQTVVPSNKVFQDHLVVGVVEDLVLIPSFL
jgi:hypothetical protein